MHTSLFLLLFSCVLQSTQGADDPFDSAMQKLITEATEAVESAGVTKVTVLDFTNTDGGTSAMGTFLAEQISVGLVHTLKSHAAIKPPIAILDRGNLASIIKEHDLTVKGLVDKKTAKQLGEFTGADGLVTGTITAIHSGYSVTVKVINVSTSEIGGATSVKLPDNAEMEDMSHRDAGGGSAPKDPSGTHVAASSHEFQSEYFAARWSKLQVLRTGDILVTLTVAKSHPEQRVNLHVTGFPRGLNTRDPKTMQAHLLEAPTTLRASTGEEYRLLETSGYPLYNYLVGQEGPGIGDTQPSTITLHFHRADGAKGVVPATTYFDLDFGIDVSVSVSKTDDYNRKGGVNVHFSDLR